MKILLKLAFLLPLLIILSCSEDDDAGNIENIDNCLSLQNQLETETVALSEATLTYAFDPNTQNCQAYKSSLEKSVSLSKQLAECVDSVNRSEYEKNIAELENILEDISC